MILETRSPRSCRPARRLFILPVAALFLSAPVLPARAQIPVIVPIETAIASGTTGAVVATLATIPGKTTWLCGFDVSAIGGTAAVGPVTVTGLIGGTFTYQLASSASGVTLGRTFTPCIPASALNTTIVITTTADGTASAVNVQAWGYVS
jgi:hypothetical protein